MVSVDVEDLAIAAPIAAEVYEDAFVLAVSSDDSEVEVVLCGGDFGVDVFWRRALCDGSDGEGRTENQRGDCLGQCSCCDHLVDLKAI